MFISIEGPEGAGKTTLASELGRRLIATGRVPYLTYEPGGTALGKEIRRIVRFGVVGGRNTDVPAPLDDRAEALLFMAARAQLVTEVLRPRLAAGEVVICDRYADSTLAYQCYGRELPMEPIRQALGFATGGLWPDLTFLLDLDPAVGLQRNRGTAPGVPVDRFEAQDLAFHKRVRDGYLALARAEPSRWLVLNSEYPIGVVADRAWQEIRRRLGLPAS